jgi:hypothetical protein
VLDSQNKWERRICWPDPDATCLEGGCGWCNDGGFWSVRTIERYAKNAGVVPNRGVGKKDAWTAFLWGLDRNFCNAEVREVE